MNSRKEMKAVLLKRYDRDLAHAIDALEVTTRPIPRPSRGQVLVRMVAAPCNQSDLLLIRGLYGVKKRLPTVPGWEGTGTVVDHGGGLVARRLTGKRVACGGQEDGDGTWAEYFVAGATGCIPLGKEISWEQGASLLVNPLTAVGLLDEAKKLGARAAVQNAAMSQAGRMLVRLFGSEGIDPIDMIFAGKMVRGFYLGEWLQKRGLWGTLRTVSRVKRLVRKGVLTTHFALRFGIDEVREGLRSYVERYSQGKALLLLDSGAED